MIWPLKQIPKDKMLTGEEIVRMNYILANAKKLKELINRMICPESEQSRINATADARARIALVDTSFIDFTNPTTIALIEIYEKLSKNLQSTCRRSKRLKTLNIHL